MNTTLLHFLDTFFTLFHFVIIVFNLLGWIHPKMRKANLTLLTLTAASWFILGIWYGIGYCPFTDWHWAVKEKLGHGPLPASYIKYWLDKITGMSFSAPLVDQLTVGTFFSALFISLGLNIRDFRRKKKKQEKN